MIIELLKLNNMKPSDLAKELGVNTGQIYTWDKKGILESNPHWKKLKTRFPSLTPRPPTLTIKGVEDKRVKGRPCKELRITATNTDTYTEQEFSSEVFPKIIFKSPK